jgi:hypothetical protein
MRRARGPSFLYQPVRRLLGLLPAHRTGAFSKNAEMFVWRHQLAVPDL